MAGLKEIRTRISSVTSTQKITGAMKMVSAAKFHKAQDTVFRFQAYSQKLSNVLTQVAISSPDLTESKWFHHPKKIKNPALVIVSSNSSMCAGFNQNLIKKVNEEGPSLFGKLWQTDKLHLYCLGKKGYDFFSKRGFNIEGSNIEIVAKPNYNSSSEFCEKNLLKPFSDGKYDAVYIAYNIFKNPAMQSPVVKQFLPFSLPTTQNCEDIDVIFEPSPELLLKSLIPTALKASFYEVVLENTIGEHGARMTAMHQATENAAELIKNLKLQYNKARQAAITKEILEIVSGAEALKG